MMLSLRSRWALALALFLVLWGARLVVVDRFGSDIPFWDQWDKEADKLYAEWFESRDAKHLILPHNEHRIFPTMALNLGLVLVSGQWDARMESVVSAALNALVLAGFFGWISGRVGRGWALAIGFILAAVGSAPIPWENVVSGFQTQFYFLIGFSLLAIGGVLFAPAFSGRWWLSIVVAGLALVSMGSGMLCAAPIAAIAAFRWAARRMSRRDAIAALTVAVAIGAAGAALHTSVPYHEVLHARSAGMFLLYFAQCLAWPLPQHPWLAALFWLPWLTLALLRLKEWRGPKSPNHQANSPKPSAAEVASDMILAIGIWVLAQAAAVSYSRSGSGELPASRYGDVFALGFIASFGAFAVLAPRLRRAPLFAGAWLLPAGICVALATREVWTGSLPGKKNELTTYEQNVRQFLLTGSFASVQPGSLPYPSADDLARILRRPPVRAILPAVIRPPLALEEFAESVTTPAPPLLHRRIRAQLETGEWRSAPLPMGNGWWMFETAGHPGEGGSTLELISATDARTLAVIEPSRLPGNSWRAAYVPAPREPAVLRARVTGNAQWLAISEPVEISTLGYRAWQLAKQGRWVMFIGLLGGFVAAAASLVARTPKTATPPSA